MTRLLTLAGAVLSLACLADGCTTSTHGAASSTSAPASGAAERLTHDSPKRTTEGNAFIAPGGRTFPCRVPPPFSSPPRAARPYRWWTREPRPPIRRLPPRGAPTSLTPHGR
jgi:hypothetical protein